MEQKEIFRFNTPKHIYFGAGCIGMIKKGIVVTSPSVYEKFKNTVEKIDGEPIVFKRLSPTGEPDEEDVLKLAEKIGGRLEKQKDLPVVSIGGGSVIDGTKLALQFDACAELTFEKLYSHGAACEPRVKLIAVETTSGTGTGVTAVAVVIGKDKLKRGLFGLNLIPDEAYYDPDITASVPVAVLANAGMDALTHAVESYTSRIHNVAADTVSLKAVELLGKNLLNAFNGDVSAREQVHYGNMLAGMGFSNARLGICHALAHLIGARFNVPHGLINAMLLPRVVDFNLEATDRFKDVADALGTSRDKLSLWISDLNKKMGIQESLSVLGGEFKKMIPRIAEEAAASSLMPANPRAAAPFEIQQMLEKAFGAPI
ncbi:MAG: iron-containing alcohol dehydrogenase family protein [bacterium]